MRNLHDLVGVMADSYEGANKTITVWGVCIYSGGEVHACPYAYGAAATLDAPVYDLTKADLIAMMQGRLDVRFDFRMVEGASPNDVPLITFWQDAANYLELTLDCPSGTNHRLKLGDFTGDTDITLASNKDYRAIVRAWPDGRCRLALQNRTTGVVLAEESGTVTFSGLAVVKARLGCLADGTGQRWMIIRGLEVR